MNTTFPPGWDKLKQAATSMPAIIAANFASQVIELQNHIAARETGNRFPSMEEINMLCKLINCMEKLKKYPTEAMSLQAINGFIQFMISEDEETGLYMADKLPDFFSRKDCNNFKPSDLEYVAQPTDTYSPPPPFDFSATSSVKHSVGSTTASAAYSNATGSRPSLITVSRRSNGRGSVNKKRKIKKPLESKIGFHNTHLASLPAYHRHTWSASSSAPQVAWYFTEQQYDTAAESINTCRDAPGAGPCTVPH